MSLEDKLHERIESGLPSKSPFAYNAILRYMSRDFPNVAFTIERGLFRVSYEFDRTNMDNEGRIGYARIGPYQPTEDGEIPSYLAEIGQYEQRGDNTYKLQEVILSETFETSTEARRWLKENGVTWDKEVVINEYE